MTQRLFPEKSESQPKIYAYQDLYNPHLKGLLKVGLWSTAITREELFSE